MALARLHALHQSELHGGLSGQLLYETSRRIVVLDRNRCTGCGLCKSACPYDAIVISKLDGKAAKCNLCVELLDAGLNPACVDGCPVKCLEAGNIAQVLASKKSASRSGIGYKNGINEPNMIIIRERR